MNNKGFFDTIIKRQTKESNVIKKKDFNACS